MKIKPIFGVDMTPKAIVLYPYVMFQENANRVPYYLLKHEMVHVEQVRRVGVVTFYITYLLSYLVGRLKGESHINAYLNIPWEVEARERQFSRLTQEEWAELDL